MNKAQEILTYWFGQLNSETGLATPEKSKIWFGKSVETDRFLTNKYKDLLEEAKLDKLNSWTESPDSTVALIILLDQFSRNIYRDTAEMYAADTQAIQIAKELITAQKDKNLPTAYRIFTYMPFMHSEKLEDQKQCIELFEKLHQSANPKAKEPIANNLKYAIAHHDIIAEYDRFPHRNKILGRTSTAAEIKFLTQPGSSF